MDYETYLSIREPHDARVLQSNTNFKDGGSGKRKYRRHPKPDENAPKRPPSAYVIFSNKMRMALKDENLSFTETAKLVGDAWQSMSRSEKESYEAQASSAKERYIAMVAEYQKTEMHRIYSEYLTAFKREQVALQHCTPEHQAWPDGSSPPNMPPFRSTPESFRCREKITLVPHASNTDSKNLPFVEGGEEDFDAEMSGYNRFPPLDLQSRQGISLSSRPLLIRSYGSSSASDASTLMTPRDALSWVGSTHSPVFNTHDSISTSNPLSSTKLVKGMLIGDYPTSSEFRFSAIATGNSPESHVYDWFPDDHTNLMSFPAYSPPAEIVEPKLPKCSRVASNDQPSKHVNNTPRTTGLPGQGIISKDGRYNQGTTFLSKSKVRHGPLSPESRHHAHLIRRQGACRDCRKRKVKCDVLHARSQTVSLASTPPRQDDMSDIPSSRQISREPSYFENTSLQGLDLLELSFRSRETTESPESNSINSFEDDFTEYSQDFSLYSVRQVQDAGSEELLAAIQPLLDRLPRNTASSLSNELLSLFGIWLGNQVPYKQAPCEGTPSSSASQNPLGASPSRTNSTGSGQKRQSDDGNYSNPSGNSEQGNVKRPRNALGPPSGSTRRWACPYHQREPHRYCVEGDFGDYRKCSKSPGFSEVHRVKQHLYDCHAAIYCSRCYTQFKTKEDLVNHRRNTEPCTLRKEQPLEGLDESQREHLKPRDRNKSEEERWKNIYRYCFPNDPIIPSPYYIHYTQETAHLRSQILHIVEEETMIVDTTIRERLLTRLRNAFDDNAHNSGQSLSPHWAPPNLDLSGSGGTYTPSTVPAMSNSGPWSQYETRLGAPQGLSRNESLESDHLGTYDNTHDIGHDLDSTFFYNDMPNFDYHFGAGDGNDRTGFGNGG